MNSTAKTSVVRAALCFAAVLALPHTASAQTYINTSQTINTDRRGIDFFTGANANGVVLTVDVGAQINGNLYTSGIRAFGDSQVNVVGGTVLGIETLTNSVLRVSGGSVGTVKDRTQAFITGGTVTDLYLTNISNSNYNSVGSATFSGGVVTHAENESGGNLLITGGTLSKYLTNAGFSTVTIKGGSMLGILYSLDQYDTYNFYGAGLTFTNPTLGRTMASPDGPGTYLAGTYYDLNGRLSDGSTIATKYFSASNNLSKVNIFETPVSSVPEPSSMWLLSSALGCLGAMRWCQRAKQA